MAAVAEELAWFRPQQAGQEKKAWAQLPAKLARRGPWVVEVVGLVVVGCLALAPVAAEDWAAEASVAPLHRPGPFAVRQLPHGPATWAAAVLLASACLPWRQPSSLKGVALLPAHLPFHCWCSCCSRSRPGCTTAGPSETARCRLRRRGAASSGVAPGRRAPGARLRR